jgi:CBS-domain-containing membrane protein
MQNTNETTQYSIGRKFKTLWPWYLIQSGLATITLIAIVLALGQEYIVTTSSLAATTFIVFAMPKSRSAQTRNVIGGHLMGLGAGGLIYLLDPPNLVAFPLAVGLATFLMVALDFEHPPAAATALALVVNEVSTQAFTVVLLAAIILSQCRYYLRHWLKDLV